MVRYYWNHYDNMGFFEEIGASIFESGANSSVVIATNCIFGALIVTLCALLLAWGINIHLIFLTILAVGLLISLNWSVHVTTVARWSL